MCDMKKALLILDMQEAFMTDDTKGLPIKIEDYVATTYYDHIIVGKFVNEMDSIFVKRLSNTKCLNKEECKLCIELSKSHVIMERCAYTMYTNELDKYLREQNIKYIYLCGLDTDRSIYKTAMDLLERGYFVYIIKNLCNSSAGTNYHNMAIQLLERQIGKDYVI